MSTVFGIVPARGGSKGIPGKNLAPLGGKPLIAWTLKAAAQSHALTRLLVSTDDPQIAEAGRRWGAEVPFLRPAELATDETPTIPVLTHALEWLETQYSPADWVVCLQPTSPFRTSEDIAAAVDLAVAHDADAVVSVAAATPHPVWTKRLLPDARLAPLVEEFPGATRRQDLPPAYAPNGAIYLARPAVLRQLNTWYTDRTYGYCMPQERSLDIDTPWDYYVAKLVARDRRRHADD